MAVTFSSKSLTRLSAAAVSRSAQLLRHSSASSNTPKTGAANRSTGGTRNSSIPSYNPIIISSYRCSNWDNSATKDPKGFQWSKLWLFLPGAITFGLGTWQIFRRQEKIDTLAHIQKRLSQEPILYNRCYSNINDLNSLEFRKMAFKGVFDDTKSLYVGPRSRSISGVTENGYYVITPLIPVPGHTESVPSPVLVNRGWVPRSWKEKGAPTKEPSKEPTIQSSTWVKWFGNSKQAKSETSVENGVDVVGVVRGSENPSIFVPQNDPSSGQWFYVDIAAMAEACGLPKGTIYVETLSAIVNPSCPYPIPKEVNSLIRSSVMPQDHLNYMFTWYTLSGAVTYMAFKRVAAPKFR